jgi:hypothetical protein
MRTLTSHKRGETRITASVVARNNANAAPRCAKSNREVDKSKDDSAGCLALYVVEDGADDDAGDGAVVDGGDILIEGDDEP